jgi:hypothetical protein
MYKAFSPKFKDTVSMHEIRPLLSAAVQTVIREPLEPLMVIQNLFTKIQSPHGATTVVVGSIGGAFRAADVGEGSTYPESMFQVGAGTQTAHMGKSGLQASFTDEALRYSTWDIFSMCLSQMAKALNRHKEKKAAAFLLSRGTVLYDNATPTASLFGVTTGRGLDMAANGALIADDLFKAVSHGDEEGYPYDILLVNPLFFYLFCQDPVLRNLMMVGAAGGSYFQNWNGTAGPRDPWSNGAQGALGPAMGNRIVPANSPSGETATGIAGREWGMNATFNIPGYWGSMLKVIASPLVPYDAESELGDMFLLSSGNVGLYLEDQGKTQVEWRDEAVDISWVKVFERYAYGEMWGGMGIGILKNIKLTRNYWDGTVNAVTHEVFEEIDSSTSPL